MRKTVRTAAATAQPGIFPDLVEARVWGQSFSSKEMIASLLTFSEVLHSPQFFASFCTGNVSLPLASFIFLPLSAICWPRRSAAESPDKA
jgi:hypothetical protein